ncbi:hypothetical protein [Marinobacterium sp. BA1]|uniref:hypothetical protein n=1 Tax=Marinobacterium sp. BA1 TaxID=3138931 RepID=UPI0032E62A7C
MSFGEQFIYWVGSINQWLFDHSDWLNVLVPLLGVLLMFYGLLLALNAIEPVFSERGDSRREMLLMLGLGWVCLGIYPIIDSVLFSLSGFGPSMVDKYIP